MLVEQNQCYSDSDYHIVGIDPGTNLGIAVYRVNVSNGRFIIKDIIKHTINLKLIENHNPNIDKLNYIRGFILSILVRYEPIAVGMETAFLARFANAVIRLTQYTTIIEQTIYNYNPYILFYGIPPKLVKKLIGATGSADKTDMFNNILKIEELKPFITMTETEHEIDAMSIGYIVHNHIKKYPYQFYMNIKIEIG